MTEVREAIEVFRSSAKQFDQDKVEVEAAVERIKAQYKELSDTWDKLDTFRRRQLIRLMAEAGLDLCTYTAYNANHQEGINELEQMGVYPVSQMRLFYRHLYYWRGGCSGGDSTRLRKELDLYCPPHFSKMRQRVSPSEVDPRVLDIESEVIRRDDRLYTVINDIDVTGTKLEYRLYPERLYHHFDLPKLPDPPRLESLQIRL